MRYVKVMVTRNPMEKCPVSVPHYEVPILERKFKPQNVQTTGEEFEVDREIPEGDVEHERLAARYGDSPAGRPWVEEVHGYDGIHKILDAERKAQPKTAALTLPRKKAELKALLDEKGVFYDPAAKVAELKALAQSVLTAEAA